MAKHEGHGKLIASLGSIRDGSCGRGIHRAEVRRHLNLYIYCTNFPLVIPCRKMTYPGNIDRSC